MANIIVFSSKNRFQILYQNQLTRYAYISDSKTTKSNQPKKSFTK